MNTMGYVCGGVLLFGCALLYVGYRTEQSKNMDKAGSSIIPYFAGAVVIMSDVVLVVGYGVYRLFSA